MKKRTKSVFIVFAFVLIIVVGVLIIMYSGSTIFSNMFSDNPEKQVQVLEIQYKINHKEKTLFYLCSALQDESLYDRNLYSEKLVTYGEIYLKSDFGKSDDGFHSQYLTALLNLGMNERFESECKAWFSTVTNTNELIWLYNALYSATATNYFDSEKQFIKDFAKEILTSEKIVSTNKQEYDELVRRYTELAEK